MSDGTALRLNLSASAAAVGVSALLILLKGWGWWTTGSLTVAASLADSALDLMVSLGALGSVLYAARPADRDHSFGHTSIEDLFALAQALMVTGSALAIGAGAVSRIGDPVGLESETTGIALMAASAALTGALVLWQRRVVARTGSRVVAADRMHYVADLLPTLAAIAALGASARWGIAWPDTLLSLGAAALLLHGAWGIGRPAFDALMDREADAQTVATIRAIAATHPGIEGFHDLRTRRSGARVFVQIHVEIDGTRPLSEAHDIGAALRRRILSVLPEADVIVHKDPAGRRGPMRPPQAR